MPKGTPANHNSIGTATRPFWSLTIKRFILFSSERGAPGRASASHGLISEDCNTESNPVAADAVPVEIWL